MIDYKDIQPYIEKKLVSESIHPEDSNVRIFNYTQGCQFSKAWDDVTLQCRGLILNIVSGEVLARPFPKFFNYQEHIQQGKPIPNEVPVITEKLDGSLGILYRLNGVERIATRGSFTSDQAIWATNWWKENRHIGMNWNSDFTHLFEIIYPQNRIVVNYDFSGLVHLASINKISGKQEPHFLLGIKKAHEFANLSFEDLEKLDEPNSEGFVVFYPKENLRLKIKFPEYVRLHKLVTGMSEIAIWEHLRDGKNLDELLEKVPDEFFDWVTSVRDRLTDDFLIIEQKAGLACIIAKEKETRKEQADFITQTEYPGITFSMLDGKDWQKGIWRLVRPHGKSQFKVDIDS